MLRADTSESFVWNTPSFLYLFNQFGEVSELENDISKCNAALKPAQLALHHVSGRRAARRKIYLHQFRMHAPLQAGHDVLGFPLAARFIICRFMESRCSKPYRALLIT